MIATLAGMTTICQPTHPEALIPAKLTCSTDWTTEYTLYSAHLYKRTLYLVHPCHYGFNEV